MKHIIATDNSILNTHYCVQYGWEIEEMESPQGVHEVSSIFVAYTCVPLYTQDNEEGRHDHIQSEVAIYEYTGSERDTKREGRIIIELLEFLESKSRTLLDLSLV